MRNLNAPPASFTSVYSANSPAPCTVSSAQPRHSVAPTHHQRPRPDGRPPSDQGGPDGEYGYMNDEETLQYAIELVGEAAVPGT